MKYRFAIRSNGLYSPSFALSKRSSGVFLTLREPILYEQRSVHFESDIMHDKRHLYRGLHKGRYSKREYEVVGEGQLIPECSYLLGTFSLCANEEEFRGRKKSHTVKVFDYDIEKNDIVTIHLVSSPKEDDIDCPPSFEIVKDIVNGPMKWLVVLEKKTVYSVYDMVARSFARALSSSGVDGVAHGSEAKKGRYRHGIFVFDLHEDYRPQEHAQMSVLVANKDFKIGFDSANQITIEGYMVRK